MLGDFQETRLYRKFDEEALGLILWRVCCGRGYGPVIRQTGEWLTFDLQKSLLSYKDFQVENTFLNSEVFLIVTLCTWVECLPTLRRTVLPSPTRAWPWRWRHYGPSNSPNYIASYQRIRESLATSLWKPPIVNYSWLKIIIIIITIIIVLLLFAFFLCFSLKYQLFVSPRYFSLVECTSRNFKGIHHCRIF